MEVMIQVPLVLPDEPVTLSALEEAVHAWGLDVQRRAMAAAWEAQAARRPAGACPRCRQPTGRPAGTKRRKLETSFGPVWVRRRRRRCPACGRRWQPDDAGLAAAVGAGQCTPRLRALAALCGASWPYQQAAAVLGRLRGSAPAPETVRAVVGRVGAAVADQHTQEAAAACRPPAHAPAHPEPAPARLEVALDGGWVRSHDNAHGMEVKVGVAHTGSERVGRTRARLRGRRYAATARGVGTFGPLVTAAVDRVAGYAAPDQTLLGDGAAWIWRVGAEVLAEATPVLDRWHLHEGRRRALRRAVPDEDRRADWAARIERCLDAGDVPGTRAVLTGLAQATAHPAVAEFAAYLAEQAPRIPDYGRRRAAGQTIGSGAIEKGVDVVVNRRLKGRRGMTWGRARADGVVAPRVAQLNGEWDQRLAAALGREP